jgi:hypothetical protein
MSLQDEIDKARADIRSDGYGVSIGEWISLYERSELDIHPEFQRFFRWSPKQKSRFIESILLGIPIPQIFVAQRDDGVWDVVDGLQRLSTIYQLVGILKNEDESLISPLTLESTKYLPSLEGKLWTGANPLASLTTAQRLLIKRAKIDVSIILRESSESTKYELFQRLNTGGSPLSDQEVRNSILIMVNRDMYRWLKELAEDTNFRECIAISDRAVDEQYDMELVTRFLVFRDLPESELASFGDVGEFLTDKIVQFAESKSYNYKLHSKAFRSTFQILNEQLGSDSFRRYDVDKKRFLGGFSVSAFEVVALGVGYNFDALKATPSQIAEKVRRIWNDSRFLDKSGSGVRASTRVPTIVPLGRKLFTVKQDNGSKNS